MTPQMWFAILEGGGEAIQWAFILWLTLWVYELRRKQ